jgi:hypothetical protein
MQDRHRGAIVSLPTAVRRPFREQDIPGGEGPGLCICRDHMAHDIGAVQDAASEPVNVSFYHPSHRHPGEWPGSILPPTRAVQDRSAVK